MAFDLAHSVVRWQLSHGRHHLPWQNTRDPYRVWLSEIMLQQTQVVTVLDYYQRFLDSFPKVATLASASLDDVLALWSGLGYYSRARNLHACAVQVAQRYDGQFPATALALQSLPGIGRSTAGAIAALCFHERVAILDGNVKRVLTRAIGFDADLAVARNEKALWDKATEMLPQSGLARSMPAYTQGMMDLGATVCLPKKPLCERCPLAQNCVAFLHGSAASYPVKTRKLKRTAQSLWLLWAEDKNRAVFLQKRPVPGVWAGLFCFALFDSRAELESAVGSHQLDRLQDIATVKHVLTHKDLYLHAVRLLTSAKQMASQDGQWFAADQWPELGLPAPIRKMLGAGTSAPLGRDLAA